MRREFHVRFCEGPGVQFPRATRLVVLARWLGPRIERWLEELLESRMGLRINRAKTRVLRVEPGGAALDFLGYSLRWERDLHGRAHHYLSIHPSAKSVQRLRAKVCALTSKGQGWKPIDLLVGELNSLLRGWWNYFGCFHRHKARSKVNVYVHARMVQHLTRRSQRPLRPPKNLSWYEYLQQRLGVLRI